MPGGSDYRGPMEALERYTAAVVGSETALAVKGAKNPYTSHNGHMFTFLDPAGAMAVRLSPEMTTEFLDTYESGPVLQHGSVMRGYVAVPELLLADTAEIARWIDRSREWIDTLEPKNKK